MDEKVLPAGRRAPNIFRLGLLFEGGLAVAACAVGAFLTTPPWRRVVWRPVDVMWGLLAAAPMFVGLLIMRRAKGGPIGRLNAVVDEMLVPLFSSCNLFQLALISAVAGIGEELLFRGVVQPVLIGWTGIIVGLCAASVIFGLLHAITVTYAILAAAVGVYLGWLTLATDNLLGPMIAHGLYDFLALVYLIRTAPMTHGDAPSTA